MRARKISMLTLTAVALGLSLTACNGDDLAGTPSSAASKSSVSTDAPKSDQGKGTSAGTGKGTSAGTGSGTSAGKGTSAGTPAKPDMKCTNQIDYSGDYRDNATINSIGSDTGTCPPVQKAPDDEKCTNKLDYAGDPRDNATINSIGSDTGTCPPVQGAGGEKGTPVKDSEVKCTDQINYADDSRDNATINSIGSVTGVCPPLLRK